MIDFAGDNPAPDKPPLDAPTEAVTPPVESFNPIVSIHNFRPRVPLIPALLSAVIALELGCIGFRVVALKRPDNGVSDTKTAVSTQPEQQQGDSQLGPAPATSPTVAPTTGNSQQPATSTPSQPAAAAAPSQPVSRQHEIKILSIAYYPIANGRLDTTIVNNNWGEYNMTLEQVRTKVGQLNDSVASTLESGTKYKGYSVAGVTPGLTYRFANKLEYLEPIPAKPYGAGTITDYSSVLARQGICNLVDNQGVKEVWLWSYTGYNRTGWESNFSSSYGDISNSDRNDSDLQKCGHSYTVYEYNYGRGVSEATEDHMHQFEAIFRYTDEDMFWNKFVGYFPGGNWGTSGTSNTLRRCGWSHFPPNGTSDYDWANDEYATSDCMDWRPDGSGQTASINCDTWNCDSRDFFVFWMQNIPGMNNGLTSQGKFLRNWWDFIGNFDEAIQTNRGLIYL